MNRVLDAIIHALEESDSKWMTSREIFLNTDKNVFAQNKQGDKGKIAIIGARIHENSELFEIDRSSRPQRVRLKQPGRSINPEIVEPAEIESQKFSFNFEQDLK